MSTATASTASVNNAATATRIQSPLVKQFLDYLKLEKHFSDYTVKSYGADLIQFGSFLAGEIGHANASQNGNGTLTPEQVDERQVKCEPLTIREGSKRPSDDRVSTPAATAMDTAAYAVCPVGTSGKVKRAFCHPVTTDRGTSAVLPRRRLATSARSLS